MMKAAKAKRREWTQKEAMNWLSRVAEGRERHGLRACSAFSYLLGIGAEYIAYALMARIHKRLDQEGQEAEART